MPPRQLKEIHTPCGRRGDAAIMSRTRSRYDASRHWSLAIFADVMDHGRPQPVLAAVDDTVLEQLVHSAARDDAANEVTPPVSPGGSWTAARFGWQRDFHRGRRAGPDGPAGEATWASIVDEKVVGSVRLKRTDERDLLETRIWLTRRARGHSLGPAVMVAVLQQAIVLGAARVRADTTAGNAAALNVLRRLGFTLALGSDGQNVQATVSLPTPAASEHRWRAPPAGRSVARVVGAARGSLLGRLCDTRRGSGSPDCPPGRDDRAASRRRPAPARRRNRRLSSGRPATDREHGRPGAGRARPSPAGAVVPVPLHLVRPAALTVGQAFRRAVAVIARSGLAAVLEDALASLTGRRRELPGRAVLGGMLDRPEALAAEPELIGRLRALRDRRQRLRALGRGSR